MVYCETRVYFHNKMKFKQTSDWRPNTKPSANCVKSFLQLLHWGDSRSFLDHYFLHYWTDLPADSDRTASYIVLVSSRANRINVRPFIWSKLVWHNIITTHRNPCGSILHKYHNFNDQIVKNWLHYILIARYFRQLCKRCCDTPPYIYSS